MRRVTAGDFHSLTRTSAQTYAEMRFHVHRALMIHDSHPTSTYTLYYWDTLTQTSLAHTRSRARASRGAEERMRWERACLSCVMWGLPCQRPLWEGGMFPSHRKWQWLQRGPPTLFIHKYQLTFTAAPHTQLVRERYGRACVCFWPDRGNLQYGSWPTESHLATQTDSSRRIPSLPVHTLQWVFLFEAFLLQLNSAKSQFPNTLCVKATELQILPTTRNKTPRILAENPFMYSIPGAKRFCQTFTPPIKHASECFCTETHKRTSVPISPTQSSRQPTWSTSPPISTHQQWTKYTDQVLE